MTNTALQITDFNFYGDTLMALKDNATGEIYTAINFVLRGIGFTEIQIRKRRDKWLSNPVISKGVLKFNIPTQGTDQKRSPTYNYDYKDTYCISIRKLPLALAKINITPKMKSNQPELSQKLELYQDKCADVLAAIFIDNHSTNDINLDLLTQAFAKTISDSLQPLYEEISSLKTLQANLQSQLPKKTFSHWTSKMFPKYQLLMDYFDISRKELYRQLFLEFQNTYPDIDLNQEQEDYCFENGLCRCFTMDVIENSKTLQILFEQMVDSLLVKYKLSSPNEQAIKMRTIFDDDTLSA